ncbi:PLP-dependent aminotransferase family protein [Bailinhaonella thermotolerans]|uniref:PLP-dependent aminotransferase family protein n=1 Tax=Bailinhaonella thermotolerans TaxID=1070861 RepID=A0A3A4BD88_9ACTN|nr:PLP-dependent aminotransferase family protein [Bailinhaonella thermotolerans]RJL36066.1 PLP-dependent aminotransferase family protein [Bailinhaonella thermotolerans]
MSERRLGGTQLARLLDVPAGARPYYRALADGVRDAILDGRIALRTRLPAERHLAEVLGVSRTTVSAAYDRLREQGYVESRQGSGSVTAIPRPGREGSADPWLAAEDDGLLPLHCAALAAPSIMPEAAAEAGAEYPRHLLRMGYVTYGLPHLRAAIAARYTARGLPTTPEQILVTSGAQHAMYLLFSLFLAPGDPLVVESPTYPHAHDAAAALGAHVVPVGLSDEHGWDLDVVSAALTQSGARMAYLVCDFQNPTGHLMDAASRRALVETARRTDTVLVADESWAELAVDDVPLPPPLAAYDRDNRVLLVGSASKLFWGGLRVGWIRAGAALIHRLARLRAAVDIAGPVFDQLVVARLLSRVEEVRAERRAQLRAGRAALTAALADLIPRWTFVTPSGGGVLWVRLDEPVAVQLAHAAVAHGVRLAPGPWFGVPGTLDRHLRLPYTQPPAVLVDAVRRIARARAQGPYGYLPADPLVPAV